MPATPYRDGAVQIRINTTDYFQNPDVTNQDGIPGLASPYLVVALPLSLELTTS